MGIRYHLEQNPVKKGNFRAILSRGKKANLQEFLEFCEKNASVSSTDVRSVVEMMAEWVVENAREGREADFGPIGQSRLGLKGDFDKQGDWVEEVRMRLTAGWQISRDLARRVEEAGHRAQMNRVRRKSKAPKIHEVRSAASKKKHVYTPGNILEIQGLHLKFDPKRSDEGVFLRQKKGASEKRLKFYQTVYPKKIVALVPDDLAGPKELLVRCRPRPKGPLEECLFSEILKSTKKGKTMTGKLVSHLLPALLALAWSVLSFGPLWAAETGPGAVPVAKSVERRIGDRDFPSVFQAWSPADNLPDEDKLETLARHDLVFRSAGFFGLRWKHQYRGLGREFTPESVETALKLRKTLLEKNPNLILIAEIRYRDAGPRFLPGDHGWWKRDGEGVVEKGWEEGKFLKLDFSNPEYRRHVAARAGAAVRTGVVDGVMLDWWRDDRDRLDLVRAVRAAVGESALILANANDRQTPRTAPYVNGYFMECYRSKTPADWKRIAETLRWAEEHLREPRVNCLETWYHRSRNDLNLMRATTALSLTHSDGYCLFSDPNPLPKPDHLHNWYPFWDKSLGRPVGRGLDRADGAVLREFQKGTAVYNPMGNAAVKLSFPEPRTSAATGERAREHSLKPADGDIFLKLP